MYARRSIIYRFTFYDLHIYYQITIAQNFQGNWSELFLCETEHEFRPTFQRPCSEEFKSLHHVIFLHAYYFIMFYPTQLSYFKPIHVTSSKNTTETVSLWHYPLHSENNTPNTQFIYRSAAPYSPHRSHSMHRTAYLFRPCVHWNGQDIF